MAGRFCGWNRPDDVVMSNSNEMMILLRSNYTAAEWHRRGFRAAIISGKITLIAAY